jgi:hypothetical protein
MRPDQNDRGQKPMKSRTDGWNPDGTERDVRDERAMRDEPVVRDERAMRDERGVRDERATRDERVVRDAQLREHGHKASPSAMQGQGLGHGQAMMADDGARSWQDIKSRFVDDPAGAMAAAAELVQHAVDKKVRALKDEAAALCVREREEGDTATENLRTRLIRCQQYCERLGK